MKRPNIELARTLRKIGTLHERKLWNLLKNRNLSGHKFRRQHQIDKYIVDFCCIEKKLIIELDGGQHNENGIIERDIARDEFLKNEGFKILRVWNNEMDDNIEGVYEKILECLE